MRIGCGGSSRKNERYRERSLGAEDDMLRGANLDIERIGLTQVALSKSKTLEVGIVVVMMVASRKSQIANRNGRQTFKLSDSSLRCSGKVPKYFCTSRGKPGSLPAGVSSLSKISDLRLKTSPPHH